jgi:hypothetical protein
LIRENLRGSLERLPGRTGMGDAQPLDHDQRALVEGVCGFYSDPLIVDRAARTKGEKKQGPAAATARRRRLPRRRFAGDGRSRPSGLYFGWGQAPENARDMRNPPGQMARVYGVAIAHATAWAARVDRARRRARIPVPTVASDPRRLALEVRGEDGVLTKVRNGLERGGVMTSTADRRWRRSGFVGGAVAESLQAPVHRKPTRSGPVKACRGSARPMVYRR